MKETRRYDDIINLPRPVSKKHPPMDRQNRAAQFSPFAALTGHSEAIKKVAEKSGEDCRTESQNSD
ncbi:MAG: hypothetical protein E7195_09620 [Peptococcaceae bacterium]|nr:hypothetical protein [Peptococcaceae bacterium]MBQ2905214.1 hypothetical protein [Peptococcaceae bacterium]MBQ3510269.1 hypothetical protein [Peptococcaceae bacterium]MBQ6887044.1 hypothetical protein [Lachnospiraceae bacterium]